MDYVNKLYELFYKPLVTPYNLLENAKLDNYQYVKYYIKNDFLVTEMKCINTLNESVIFYYLFDKDNLLQQIYQKFPKGKKELLFDRHTEFENLRESYYNSSKNSMLNIK